MSRVTLSPEAFVLGSLPLPPARVLEVGAGAGELAGLLAERGYNILAIDPASSTLAVEPVALRDLHEPRASFDAAVAVLSLHHVEPLADSCRHLASLLRAGGQLVIDEFDLDRFNVAAASWWLSQAPAIDHSHHLEAEAIVAEMHEHLHALPRILAALEPWFEFSAVERGPYLYRWKLPAGARADEERAIAGGRIPATGARVVGRRC